MRRAAPFVCSFLLGWATLSWARTEETTPYTKTQAYNGALRFLRIEQEFEVIERDPDLGYVLFQYPTGVGDATTTGSLEVVEREDEVLVVVQISKLPAHHESRLVGALLKKLEADYGAPKARVKDKPPKKAPESEPDEDADDAESDDEQDGKRRPAPGPERAK
jgi:hypothetical protein